MNNKPLYLITVSVLAFIAAVLIVIYLGSIFLPLSFALFRAFLYDPLVIPLEKKGMKRPAAAILVFSIGFLITILLGYFYISFLIEEFRNIQVSLPEYASRLYGYIPYKVKVFFDIDTPEKIDAHIN